MENSLCRLRCGLFALLMFALSGCGATNTTTAAMDGTKAAGTGKITANLVLPKSTAKTVASLAVVTQVRLTVTGATIPTASSVTPGSAGGTVTVYPGRNLTVTAQSLDASGAVQFEGLVPNVTVDAGIPTTVSITLSDPATYAKAETTPCLNCHDATRDTDGSNLVANYKQSGHYRNMALSISPKNGSTLVGCAGCHGTQHNDLNPAASGRCADCHTSVNTNHNTYTGGSAPISGVPATTCGNCHITHNFELATAGCIGCHSIPQNSGAANVQDNNGVRSIAEEFTKWSHHVTGVALNNAHCAACHLEGTVVGGQVVVDPAKHMHDATTHLRNADTDADFAWNPAAPDHSGMDTFCMSCHDSNGATSAGSKAIQAFINTKGINAQGKTASASNPFGDTISNQYDKMQRPAVVDASSQFNTTNNSHHAVKGKRYTGRSRVSNGGTVVDATFTANSSANLNGKRTTIYDAGKFNTLYVTLQNAGGETNTPGSLTGRNGGTKLGDDSTLHCGDCHTVGQWKVGSSYTAKGLPTPAAIGAHGSVNEYLLRNSIGTDARHQGIQMDASAIHEDSVTPYLICYSCHAIANYGDASHVGEQVVGENNCDTPVNTNTVNAIGTARINSQNTMSYGTNVVGAPTGATNGNIYGIQCNNCHNSGISAGNIFGGIHGSADPTYKDGAGNTTKHERFLPGLGNVMYAPGTRGGITGGTTAFQSYSSAVQKTGISKGLRFKGTYAYTTGGVTNDANWEEKARIPVGDGVTGWSHNPGAAGCYTISEEPIVPANAEGNGVPAGPPASLGLTAPDGTLLVGNWGGCVDHGQQQGASVRQPRNTNTSIRPVSY